MGRELSGRMKGWWSAVRMAKDQARRVWARRKGLSMGVSWTGWIVKLLTVASRVGLHLLKTKALLDNVHGLMHHLGQDSRLELLKGP